MNLVERGEINPKAYEKYTTWMPVERQKGLMKDIKDKSAEERQARIDATLVKDADNPETMVQTVMYFIENSFVTGVCLPVDGGRTVFAGSSG